MKQNASERGAGYVDELTYTFSYCDELNPLRGVLPLLSAGWAPPIVETACELGFGYGLSGNLHAAGAPVAWYGTDLITEHADFASRLGERSKAAAQWSAESFQEFCRRDDLPGFDFIGMHGTWSWISAENRAEVVDFLRRKLNPGGVFYVSYNSAPGWSAMLPVREIMRQHFESEGRASSGSHALSALAAATTDTDGQQTIGARIRAAVEFAQTLFETQPGYGLLNPQLSERVRALSGQPLHYLAHEYFNRDWQPMFFSQVAASLNVAGLRYAGTATYRDRFDEINLDAKQSRLLAEIPNDVLRETTRDVCMNQSFRRDYWIKQPRRLSLSEQLVALRAHRVVLALPANAVRLTLTGARQSVALPAARYAPMLAALADHRVKSLGEIEQQLDGAGLGIMQIVEMVMRLIAMGVLLNAQTEAQSRHAQAASDRLNAAICERATLQGSGAAVEHLVSPVSASGIAVPTVAQLFLLARSRNCQTAAQSASFAANYRNASSERSTQAAAGASMLTATAALLAQAENFELKYLPILEALGVRCQAAP